GTLGVQVLDGENGTVRLEAYFEEDGPEGLPGARFLGAEEVPAADWLAPYREAAQPFPVGERLLLDPRDPDGVEPPAARGRLTLRIPARAAFGTGSHESTRLALELLEGVDLRGKRVLDVGTGTGILAFAARAFGARSAIGLDVDRAAPLHARANARLNGLSAAFFAGSLDALGGVSASRFDLALVNVIPEEVADELPRIASLLCPGGEAILSGILAIAGPRVLADWQALGLEPVAERTAAEWVAFRVRKAGR
ncbi:MAG TPA: 50S ribosomal protein L11 methyltransferase, partial [Thermoanaerobaculia bacterium]|nr:50S ribosomal protein L11 methyltransferase [Thermoanaerobaculia bacterium]